MTLARSSAEAEWLERSLRALSELGLQVYAADGGSDGEFLKRISRLPGLVVCPHAGRGKPTLVGQLRTAFEQAQQSHAGPVFYTEPDKLIFFRRGARSLLAAAREKDASWHGLVIVERGARQFATFPEGQRVAESLMNQLAGEALDKAGDYTYGPLLISSSLLPYTRKIPEKLGWGWRFFLMGIARQLRASIELLPVGSQCPRAQQNEDDRSARAYRLRQLTQNVTGLANGWTSLLDEPQDATACMVAAA